MFLLETALGRAAKAAAVLIDDPRKSRQILQRHGSRQPQRSRGHNAQRLKVKGVRFDLGRRIKPIRKAKRRDVDLAAAKLRQKLLGPSYRDAQHQIREALAEPI